MANDAGTPDHEPDYRFTLANERTFLAWIRTALALLAGSVAVVQLIPPFSLHYAREGIAVALAGASVLLCIHSGYRWHRIQRAMRRDEDLPKSSNVAVLAGAIALISFFVLILALAFGAEVK